MTGGASEPGIVMSECYSCHNAFSYDPACVPSIPVDPDTRRPPDLGGDLDKTVNQPICPNCCKRANIHRRATGLTLWTEEDTAATYLARTTAQN